MKDHCCLNAMVAQNQDMRIQPSGIVSPLNAFAFVLLNAGGEMHIWNIRNHQAMTSFF
jgi:hypothetical protein